MLKVRLDNAMTLVSTANRSVTKLDAPRTESRSARTKAERGDDSPSAVPVATVELGAEQAFVVATGPGVALDRAILTALLREQHPTTPVVFATSSRPGSVSAEVDGELAAAEVAAAAAVVQASWAWDESDPISVVVGPQVFAVELGYEDGLWDASPVPRRLADVVKELLSYRLEDPDEPKSLVKLMREHEALIAYESWTGYLFLRADGSAFYIDEEDPGTDALPGITDKNRATLALVLGARRWPELGAFLPPEDAASIECPSCNGTGMQKYGPHEVLCGDCGALGRIMKQPSA